MEEWTPDDSWKNDVEEKIDTLRKSNVKINFFDIDATLLTVDVQQKTHNFPFGQAVQSKSLSDCYLANYESKVCSHVSENYNWIVDTYRFETMNYMLFNLLNLH